MCSKMTESNNQKPQTPAFAKYLLVFLVSFVLSSIILMNIGSDKVFEQDLELDNVNEYNVSSIDIHHVVIDTDKSTRRFDVISVLVADNHSTCKMIIHDSRTIRDSVFVECWKDE